MTFFGGQFTGGLLAARSAGAGEELEPDESDFVESGVEPEEPWPAAAGAELQLGGSTLFW
jgi:hypothetical protein